MEAEHGKLAQVEPSPSLRQSNESTFAFIFNMPHAVFRHLKLRNKLSDMDYNEHKRETKRKLRQMV
jgi:hypothetical protein